MSRIVLVSPTCLTVVKCLQNQRHISAQSLYNGAGLSGTAKTGLSDIHLYYFYDRKTGPRSEFGNLSGYRCESDFCSSGPEFDPGPVLYFHGD